MNEGLQRTDEWIEQRIGKFTASEICDLMVGGRKKEEVFGKTALAYIYKKLAERLTGEREAVFVNDAMQWGTYQEEFAIKAYEALTGKEVTEVGFVPCPGFEEWAGGSPDGLLLEDNGIVEAKCFYGSTRHIECLINNAIPETYQAKYYAQVQMNMACTGAVYCDFISFDPRMKDEVFQLNIIRIDRDESFIIELLNRIQEAASFMQKTGLLVDEEGVDGLVDGKEED